MLVQFKNVAGLVNLQFAVLFQFTYNDEQYENVHIGRASGNIFQLHQQNPDICRYTRQKNVQRRVTNQSSDAREILEIWYHALPSETAPYQLPQSGFYSNCSCGCI